MLESANSELESADSSADSNADASKVGGWVWAFIHEYRPSNRDFNSNYIIEMLKARTK